jgi:hypothetical protein
LKEKERTVNASVDRQKKQTRTPSLTGGAALTELLTLIFMIFDRNIENLKAREGDYGGIRERAQFILEKILAFSCPRSLGDCF